MTGVTLGAARFGWRRSLRSARGGWFAVSWQAAAGRRVAMRFSARQLTGRGAGSDDWEITAIGTWYLSLGFSLFLVLIGIYIHWSVVLIGALLPLWPMIATLIGRRRARARDTGSSEEGATPTHDADGRG